jgi:hypothetical protein
MRLDSFGRSLTSLLFSFFKQTQVTAQSRFVSANVLVLIDCSF